MPLKNTKYRYVDVDLHFRKHPLKNDVLRIVDSGAVKQSVKNLVMMDYFDKPFKPEIHCAVSTLLFEPMDFSIATSIEDLIRNTLDRYEPRIEVQTVRVIANYEAAAYNVTIIYSLIEKPNNIERLEFALDRVR